MYERSQSLGVYFLILCSTHYKFVASIETSLRHQSSVYRDCACHLSDKPPETSFAQQARRVREHEPSSVACDDLRLMFGRFDELYGAEKPRSRRHLHSLSATAVTHAKNVLFLFWPFYF